MCYKEKLKEIFLNNMYKLFILLFFVLKLSAVEVHDFSVKPGAIVDSSNGFNVEIFWEPDPKAINYEIAIGESSSFTNIEKIAGNRNSYTFFEADFFRGVTREIKIEKVFTLEDSTGKGWGYLEIGYGLPEVIDKGNILLCIDNIMYDSVEADFLEYVRALNLHGFNAEFVKVPRADYYNTKAVLQTKEITKAKYEELNGNLDYIILVGRVAVPYSGSTSPDGHSDETFGAWPADHFYGEFDGNWTDYLIDTVRELSPEVKVLHHHNNSAWDGKWDQTILPSEVEVSVGRIDVSDLTYFEESEAELLKRYFRKNIKWRKGEIDYPRRTLLDDKFGFFNSELFATEAWRNFSALVGYDNIDELSGRWDLRDKEYLFFWGAASGGYTGISETAFSFDYANHPYYGVFGFIFGSRILEFMHPNNTLKAQIASEPSFLSSIWSVRPNWFLHNMATGKTLGEVSKNSINNGVNYDNHGFKAFTRAVFMNVIGDPTLEMLVTDPPQNVKQVINGNEVELSWELTPDAEYYNIYFAESLSSEKVKLNENPITDNSFVTNNSNGIYIVKSVKLQITNSGSYWLESIGVVAE